MRIFPPKTSNRGFTLIEVLIVVLVIVFILALAVPRLSSITRVGVDTGMREIAGVVKDAYNATMVTGHVHRMVYDLETRQYWVERGPKDALLDTEISREREEERKRLLGGDYEPPKVNFTEVASLKRKKRTLPNGVQFEDVVTEQYPDPIKEGKGYTHFFPNGLTEQTIVHLKDLDNHKVSIIVLPTTGKTKIVYDYVEPDEVLLRKEK